MIKTNNFNADEKILKHLDKLDYFFNGHFKEYMTPPMGESFDEFKFRITSFSHSIEKMLLKNNLYPAVFDISYHQ